MRGGGAAALAAGRASDRHGDPREPPSSRGSPDAVALWGSLDPRAAERRARHHGRELERLAGRRVDDRIVSAGGGLGAPSAGWAGWGPRSESGHPTSPPAPPAGPRFRGGCRCRLRSPRPDCSADTGWSHPLASYRRILSFFLTRALVSCPGLRCACEIAFRFSLNFNSWLWG